LDIKTSKNLKVLLKIQWIFVILLSCANSHQKLISSSVCVQAVNTSVDLIRHGLGVWFQFETYIWKTFLAENGGRLYWWRGRRLYFLRM